MRQASPIIATMVKPSTPEQWREIWLKKMERACVAEGLKATTVAGFIDFISRYLFPHTCHPGEISAKALIEFLDNNKKSEKQAKFCRDALEQGVDLRKIQVLLGHSSVKTTQIYTHVSREEIAKIRSPLASLMSQK